MMVSLCVHGLRTKSTVKLVYYSPWFTPIVIFISKTLSISQIAYKIRTFKQYIKNNTYSRITW